MKAHNVLRHRHRSAILWAKLSAGVGNQSISRQKHVCKWSTSRKTRYHSVLASKQPDDSTKGAIVPTADESQVPTVPIDFEVAAKIEGEESHIATIELKPGEKLRAESGSMLFMTDGVEMETTMQGMSSAFSRMLTGQNLFFTDFQYTKESGTGTVCLGTDFPSKILRFDLDQMPNSSLICQKGAYLASNPNVNIEMEFTKSFTAGFFGGEGFVLQKLSGEGDVLVKGGGTIVTRTLVEGEVLRVTSGSLVAFESTVSYDVQMVQGIRNAMFGGEGLFITSLTGPGTVWLQGMPPDRMIAEIARRVPSGSGLGLGIPIGIGGGGGGEGAASGADVAAAGAADSVGAGAAGAAMSEAASVTPESVAAEEAIQADRNATVATSGIDSESPSALFGDAAPDEGSASFSSPSGVREDSQPSQDSFEDSQPAQDDSFAASTNEQMFQDDDVYDSGSSNNVADGELFNDTGEASTPSVDDGDSSGGLFQSLWDIFTGGDE